MYNFDKIRIPLNGTFELTARCNLSCKMCHIRIDNKRIAELGGRERSAEEWILMAREVCQAGTLELLLTGGEPMLRPDFIEIYRAISEMGFILTLYTNATLITPEIMKLLEKYPPHNIGISVYGASAETYEKVTGSGDAYERMLEGVKKISDLPSNLTVRTTIIQDNLEDLPEISRWVNNLGRDVDFNVSRIVIKPVRGGVADAQACRLTPKQNVRLLQQLGYEGIIKSFTRFLQENPDAASDRDMQERSFAGTDDMCTGAGEKFHTDMPTIYGCDAGINSYTITWDGKLIGCQLLGDCCTYPFKEGFLQAWDLFPGKVKLPLVPDECKGCKTACSACPATRLAETGRIDGWPEYLCSEAKLKKKMKDDMLSELPGSWRPQKLPEGCRDCGWRHPSGYHCLRSKSN